MHPQVRNSPAKRIFSSPSVYHTFSTTNPIEENYVMFIDETKATAFRWQILNASYIYWSMESMKYASTDYHSIRYSPNEGAETSALKRIIFSILKLSSIRVGKCKWFYMDQSSKPVERPIISFTRIYPRDLKIQRCASNYCGDCGDCRDCWDGWDGRDCRDCTAE